MAICNKAREVITELRLLGWITAVGLKLKGLTLQPDGGCDVEILGLYNSTINRIVNCDADS